MSDDYKEDIKVDFLNLHVCYRDQASNYMKWAEKWANKVSERDKRKRFLRVNARKYPDNYDLPSNPSAAAVNAILEEDEELIDLTYQVNILASAKEALGQRKFIIDGLVKLWLNGYYQGPYPEEMKTIKEERGHRVREAQQEGLSQSKRIGGRRHGIGSEEEDESTEGGPSETTQGEHRED
jgi:hypothetical protein